MRTAGELLDHKSQQNFSIAFSSTNWQMMSMWLLSKTIVLTPLLISFVKLYFRNFFIKYFFFSHIANNWDIANNANYWVICPTWLCFWINIINKYMKLTKITPVLWVPLNMWFLLQKLILPKYFPKLCFIKLWLILTTIQ